MEKFAVRKTKFALFILAVSHHTFCSVKIHVVKLQGRNKIYEVKWSGRNKIYEVKPPKRNKVYEVNPQKRNKIYYMKRPGQKTLQFAKKSLHHLSRLFHIIYFVLSWPFHPLNLFCPGRFPLFRTTPFMRFTYYKSVIINHPTRPEGPRRCPGKGNEGGLFVFFATFGYYLCTDNMVTRCY